MLYNRKLHVSVQIKADEDGWVRFPRVPAATYRLTIDGPSHESFEVVLNRANANERAIFISFRGDYCDSVSLRNEPITVWDF